MKIYILIFIGIFGLVSCHSKKAIESVSSTIDDGFVFLDSLAAAQVIIVDETDGFFERITPIDMAIQVKKPMKGEKDRTKMVKDYRIYLQEDVSNFSLTERTLLTSIMRKAIRLCDSLSNKILPTTIQLIKTKGKHYGDGTFYTRDNSIIIPASDLKNPNKKQLLQVMLHEISHIVTRYHPILRDKLYNLIGFEKILNKENRLITEPLNSLLLANPDGMNMEYAMQVHSPDGELVWVLPLLYSSKRDFRPKSPAFFSYLKFELFKLTKKENGQFFVFTDKGGHSSLMLEKLPDFFKKIGDNTQYIIHPDEIIADNFWMMLLATQAIDGMTMDKFSAEGKILIREVERVIRAY